MVYNETGPSRHTDWYVGTSMEPICGGISHHGLPSGILGSHTAARFLYEKQGVAPDCLLVEWFRGHLLFG